MKGRRDDENDFGKTESGYEMNNNNRVPHKISMPSLLRSLPVLHDYSPNPRRTKYYSYHVNSKAVSDLKYQEFL